MNIRKQIGQSGTQIYSGIITAEEYNKKLTGKELIRQIEIMRRSDTTVAMVLEMVSRPIADLVWDIEPASEDQVDFDIAEQIEKDLFDNPNFSWDRLLDEILTYLPFGCAVFECRMRP